MCLCLCLNSAFATKNMLMFNEFFFVLKNVFPRRQYLEKLFAYKLTLSGRLKKFPTINFPFQLGLHGVILGADALQNSTLKLMSDSNLKKPGLSVTYLSVFFSFAWSMEVILLHSAQHIKRLEHCDGCWGRTTQMSYVSYSVTAFIRI